MPALPEGDPAPSDGALPASVAEGPARGFGIYLHVPFCARRCGYCDFNTYTPSELDGTAARLNADYLRAASAEIELAARVLDKVGLTRPVQTVFFGGGTPTMLAASELTGLLGQLHSTWGLVDGVEVTTEANPDSVSKEYLLQLAEGGFNRVSFGMQSSVSSVLKVLDRTHDPARVAQVVEWAREAGLATSLDLIYGTPGESLDDWRRSLAAAIELAPEHLSAYSLTVEPGTALFSKVNRGQLAGIDSDDQAAKYELADDLLSAAGYHWYEVSNWARRENQWCQHNLGYWRGDDWWGIGPGAHSHVGGVRWWNVKHPARYAGLLAEDQSPAAGREVLDADSRQLEAVMLGVRLREGLPLDLLPPNSEQTLTRLADEGLMQGLSPVVLTRRGRLLADYVVRELLT